MSLGVLVLVGGVAYEWHQERTAAAKKQTSVAKAKAAPRETKQRPAVVPPVPVQSAAAPVVAPKPTVAPAAAPKAPPVVAAAAPKAPATAPKPATAEKAPEKTPEKAPVAAGGHRLVVRTEGEAWIEIKDGSDRMLVSSLNPPGSERVVRGRPPYSLVIGNASNVRVLYDDKLIDLAPHTKQDVARFTLP
jgi:cytoskeleton protein RodZ